MANKRNRIFPFKNLRTWYNQMFVVYYVAPCWSLVPGITLSSPPSHSDENIINSTSKNSCSIKVCGFRLFPFCSLHSCPQPSDCVFMWNMIHSAVSCCLLLNNSGLEFCNTCTMQLPRTERMFVFLHTSLQVKPSVVLESFSMLNTNLCQNMGDVDFMVLRSKYIF